MYKIDINHRDERGRVAYSIYREEEAKKIGINYKYWKEAEEGEYALSDDGFVALVLKRKLYNNDRGGKNIYLKMPYGYVMYNPKYPTKRFNAEGRSTPHTFSGKPQLEVKSKQAKMQNLAMCYVATNFNRDLAIDMAIGSLDPSQLRSWRRKMKSEIYQDMVKKEVQEALVDHGLTEDFVLRTEKEALEIAKEKKDVSNMMRIVENLQDLHGMKDKKVIKTTSQLTGTITRKMLDEVNEEERKLVATEVKEEEGGEEEEI